MQRSDDSLNKYLNDYCKHLIAYLDKYQEKFSSADRKRISGYRERLGENINLDLLASDLANFAISHSRRAHKEEAKILLENIPRLDDGPHTMRQKLNAVQRYVNAKKSTHTVKNTDYDHFMKITLVGDEGSGRSNIIRTFSGEDFSTVYNPMGTSFKEHILKVGGDAIQYQIWRSGADSKQHGQFSGAEFRGALAYCIVIDATDSESLKIAKNYLDKFRGDISHNDKPIMLLANKCDLIDQIAVREEEIKEFAESNNLLYKSVSAKTQTNIELALRELARNVLRAQKVVTNEYELNPTEIYNDLILALEDPAWKSLTSKLAGTPKGFKNIIGIIKSDKGENSNELLDKIKEEANKHTSETIPRMFGKETFRNSTLREVYVKISKASSLNTVQNILENTLSKLEQDSSLENRF